MNNEAGIQGESSLKMDDITGFHVATVGVSRQYIRDRGSKKYFYVSAVGGSPYNKYFYTNDIISLDTAFVLGVKYENVIKFEPDLSEQTKLKSIYFAKNFGFIKIETIDGKTLERIP